ncbi:MAG TPA: TetR/AcrR family transcriptional regulator [Roseiarcus sp.]|jgi:AcrR family transcriptional regulator
MTDERDAVAPAADLSADATPEQLGARRQILNAAALLLRHRGYEATTTRAIASAVGIKGGSIYHHFPSKDAIVGEVVNEGVRVVYDAVVAALAALPADAGPRLRLETAIKAHLLSSLEHSDYTSASIRTFAFLPDAVRRECRAERRRYEDLWRGLVNELYCEGLIDSSISQDSVRLLLLGALNWAGEWYRTGRMDIDEISRDFAACVLHSK